MAGAQARHPGRNAPGWRSAATGGGSAVGAVGDLASVRARIEKYTAAGLDEIAISPVLDGDPGASGRSAR
jgi:hypothetical protein